MTGRLSWFDVEQVRSGERFEYEARAELLTHIPPYAWHGALVLTSDRLFFLPEISNTRIGGAAFWLDDIVGVVRTGRHRIHVSAQAGSASFELLGQPLAPRDRSARWIDRIAELKSEQEPVQLITERRRRAG